MREPAARMVQPGVPETAEGRRSTFCLHNGGRRLLLWRLFHIFLLYRQVVGLFNKYRIQQKQAAKEGEVKGEHRL